MNAAALCEIRTRPPETQANIVLAMGRRLGWRIITPEQNAQPDPALRIASIHIKTPRGQIIGLGATVQAAALDLLNQAGGQV